MTHILGCFDFLISSSFVVTFLDLILKIIFLWWVKIFYSVIVKLIIQVFISFVYFNNIIIKVYHCILLEIFPVNKCIFLKIFYVSFFFRISGNLLRSFRTVRTKNWAFVRNIHLVWINTIIQILWLILKIIFVKFIIMRSFNLRF